MRSELFHPLSVHFPIALVVLFFGLKIFGYFVRKEEQKNDLKKFNFVVLTLSLVSVFISIYLGDMAFEVVRSNLCQIGKVDQHEELSKLLALTLFVTLTIETLVLVFESKIKDRNIYKLKEIFTLLLSIVALAFLFQTSHSGAMLVYEQGAGVLNHTKSCQ